MIWRATDPQGNEAGKVKYDIVPFTRGMVLDLGCGPNKAFPHFVGVDNCIDTKLFGIEFKPDYQVADCSDLSDFETEACDAVFSSHLLEHIEDTEKALREWWRVIKVGGYLVLYLPHAELYPNVGEPGANPDHKHDFTNFDIFYLMSDLAEGGFDVVRDEVRSDGMEYSFLQVYRKRNDGQVHTPFEEEPMLHQSDCALHNMPAHPNGPCNCTPQKAKTVCVVRYGGFGDQIQAANILPELKRQGYHVTFMTTPRGQDILKHDPHIDAWLIQDDDQVPNHELPEYWKAQAKRFDKFVNLCESVEGTLLAMPGRANHAWPDDMRRKYLGQNYLEFTAELAQLPYTSESRFYPSDDEREQVKRYLAHVSRDIFKPANVLEQPPESFFILWALSGSSVHKFYPWQDSVIARILVDIPEAVIIFTGDTACQILEAGWENEPRIRRESGNMGIRNTLALAQSVNCVVGPETGVLNAVAFENVGKVILLSHSSKENLTKHWINTATIEPRDTPCYPCHRLHYGREFCPEHEETGAAMCQINITPDRVYEAVEKHYDDWQAVRRIIRSPL